MRGRSTSRWVWVAIAGTSTALAHGGGEAPTGGWQNWTSEPAIIATLFFTGAIYVAGLRTLRRSTAVRTKLRSAAWCYALGWALLALALVSPVHAWGQVFFSVHMVQHELLMVAAAPLVILGRPLLVMLSALPRPSAHRLVEVLQKNGGKRIWRGLTDPFMAWLLHALALWLWHVPGLFTLTLENEGVHALQHASFLGSALVFWHAVFFGPRRRRGYGMAVVYLFTTALHSGALGALLTFASRAWYPAYTYGPAGLNALEDQQLGGLIMWIPAGVIYAVAGLVLFALWLRAPGVAIPSRPSTPAPCASPS